MTVSTAGKSAKQLMEARAKVVTKAKAFLSENEDNWSPAKQTEYDGLISEAGQYTEALERRRAITDHISGRPLPSDHPMEGFGRRRGGRHVRDDVVFLSPGESLAATSGFEPPCDYALGECIRSMLAPHSQYSQAEVFAALGTGQDSAGGYTVPVELSSEVIDLAYAQAVFSRAGGRLVVMKNQETRIARVESAPSMEVKAENAAFSDGTMTIGGIALQAFLIGCYIEASREIISDSPNFGQLVQTELAKSLADSLDRYAIQGTGSAEPTGLTVHPDIDETGSVGAVAWSDVSTAATTIRTNDYEPTAAIMSPTIRDDLLLQTDSENRWLGPPPTIENVQLLHTSNCPNANMIIGDFSNALWGLRQSAMIETTNEAGDLFQRHMVGIKITWRGDFAIARGAAFHRLAGITT